MPGCPVFALGRAWTLDCPGQKWHTRVWWALLCCSWLSEVWNSQNWGPLSPTAVTITCLNLNPHLSGALLHLQPLNVVCSCEEVLILLLYWSRCRRSESLGRQSPHVVTLIGLYLELQRWWHQGSLSLGLWVCRQLDLEWSSVQLQQNPLWDHFTSRRKHRSSTVLHCPSHHKT